VKDYSLSVIELSPEQRAALSRVADRMSRQLRASERFVGEPPAPSSSRHTAYANGYRDEFDIAGLALHAGEDHLRTLLAIFHAGMLPSFALYTVLRGATEALARAMYLLDEPSVAARRAHALNVRLENLVEAAKVTKNRARLSARLQHLGNRAVGVGIAVIPSKGVPAGFGAARLPSRLQMVAEAVDNGEFLYRLMSGYGHAMQWALIELARAQSSEDPDVASVPTDLNVERFLEVLDRILDMHDRLVGLWLTLSGYPIEVWRAAKGG
jgi:hypothetical protein